MRPTVADVKAESCDESILRPRARLRECSNMHSHTFRDSFSLIFVMYFDTKSDKDRAQ